METRTKWIIGISAGVVGLAATAYLTRKYWMPKSSDTSSSGGGVVSVSNVDTKDIPERTDSGRPNQKTFSDSFSDLKKNLGANISSAGNRVSLKFNAGKNTADFYNNGRVIFGTVGKTGYLMKGSYTNGGKNINIDEADGGYTASSGSVWGNLLTILDKKNGK